MDRDRELGRHERVEGGFGVAFVPYEPAEPNPQPRPSSTDGPASLARLALVDAPMASCPEPAPAPRPSVKLPPPKINKTIDLLQRGPRPALTSAIAGLKPPAAPAEVSTPQELIPVSRLIRRGGEEERSARLSRSDRHALFSAGVDLHAGWRPRTRGDCESIPRPCPFVGCRHHLLLDVRSGGMISAQAEDLWTMEETCSLDVAEKAARNARKGAPEALTLERVGELLGVTKERVRQLEKRALRVLKKVEEDSI